MEPTQANPERRDEQAAPVAGTLGQVIQASRKTEQPIPVAAVVSIFDDLLAADADPLGPRAPDLDDVLIDQVGVARLDVAADLAAIARLLVETLADDVPAAGRWLIERLKSDAADDQPADSEQLRAWLRDALGQPADRDEVLALVMTASAPLPVPEAVPPEEEAMHDVETIPPHGALMAPLMGLGPSIEAQIPTDQIRKRTIPVGPLPVPEPAEGPAASVMRAAEEPPSGSTGAALPDDIEVAADSEAAAGPEASAATFGAALPEPEVAGGSAEALGAGAVNNAAATVAEGSEAEEPALAEAADAVSDAPAGAADTVAGAVAEKADAVDNALVAVSDAPADATIDSVDGATVSDSGDEMVTRVPDSADATLFEGADAVGAARFGAPDSSAARLTEAIDPDAADSAADGVLAAAADATAAADAADSALAARAEAGEAGDGALAARAEAGEAGDGALAARAEAGEAGDGALAAQAAGDDAGDGALAARAEAGEAGDGALAAQAAGDDAGDGALAARAEAGEAGDGALAARAEGDEAGDGALAAWAAGDDAGDGALAARAEGDEAGDGALAARVEGDDGALAVRAEAAEAADSSDGALAAAAQSVGLEAEDELAPSEIETALPTPVADDESAVGEMPARAPSVSSAFDEEDPTDERATGAPAPVTADDASSPVDGVEDEQTGGGADAPGLVLPAFDESSSAASSTAYAAGVDADPTDSRSDATLAYMQVPVGREPAVAEPAGSDAAGDDNTDPEVTHPADRADAVPADEGPMVDRRPADEGPMVDRRPADETLMFDRRPADEGPMVDRRPADETLTFDRRPAVAGADDDATSLAVADEPSEAQTADLGHIPHEDAVHALDPEETIADGALTTADIAHIRKTKTSVATHSASTRAGPESEDSDGRMLTWADAVDSDIAPDLSASIPPVPVPPRHPSLGASDVVDTAPESPAEASGRDDDEPAYFEGDTDATTLTIKRDDVARARAALAKPSVVPAPTKAETQSRPRVSRGVSISGDPTIAVEKPSPIQPVRKPESGRSRPVVRHQLRRDAKISVPVAPAARRTARQSRPHDSIMGPSDRGFPWGWLVVVGMVAAAAYYLLFT